jgi:hypothetical protein
MILRNKAFALSFFAIFLVTYFLLSRIDLSVSGATSMELVAGCQIYFLDKTIQPTITMAFACPGKDYLRLWPLPVIQPWIEDWDDTPVPKDNLIIGMELKHVILR